MGRVSEKYWKNLSELVSDRLELTDGPTENRLVESRARGFISIIKSKFPCIYLNSFGVVGYGCMTCIGNSGPLQDVVVEAVEKGDLVVAGVLSGNRNFEVSGLDKSHMHVPNRKGMGRFLKCG